MPKPIKPWELDEAEFNDELADLAARIYDVPVDMIKHGTMGRDINQMKSVTRNKVKVAKKR